MHAVRVQYTVRPDFVATNEANIRAVMDELRALGEIGVYYSAFRLGDGLSFLHLVVMDDVNKAGIVPGLAAFKDFRTALREGLQSPPSDETWTVVGTSFAG
jgi:hypothetical protein